MAYGKKQNKKKNKQNKVEETDSMYFCFQTLRLKVNKKAKIIFPV